eukprot:13353746-Ditylum_brightwellii.AAC.1
MKYKRPSADVVDAAYTMTASAKHNIRCDSVAYVAVLFLPISAPTSPDKEEDDSNLIVCDI